MSPRPKTSDKAARFKTKKLVDKMSPVHYGPETFCSTLEIVSTRQTSWAVGNRLPFKGGGFVFGKHRI